MPLVTIYLDENGRNSIESVVATVVRGEGCWKWPTTRTGAWKYKTVNIRGKIHQLHRLMYEQLVGPIPPKYEIDHLCLNPECCNPAHLEAVPKAENIRRGNSMSARFARRTHCAQGHPFDEANTRIRLHHGRPSRECITCTKKVERARTVAAPKKTDRRRGSETHCSHGHLRAEFGTTDRKGSPACRECCRIKMQKRRHPDREAILPKGKPGPPRQEVCKRGHVQDEENRFVTSGGNSGCRVCKNMRRRPGFQCSLDCEKGPG